MWVLLDMGILHGNANFYSNEIPRGEKLHGNGIGGKILGCKEKAAPVSYLHQIPAERFECTHAWLLPVLVALILNTAARC